jgi:group I intron endonuclease
MSNTIYTVYKTTNLVNGKIYIGVHKENDKVYFGSSIPLKQSITKHGIENFKKEILFTYNTKEKAYLKESELVNEDFVKRQDTYNLRKGGEGGTGYPHSKETRKKISDANKGQIPWCKGKGKEIFSEEGMSKLKDKVGKKNSFYGKQHSNESLAKMSNSMKGMKWWNNGKEQIRAKEQPEGYQAGRITKRTIL